MTPGSMAEVALNKSTNINRLPDAGKIEKKTFIVTFIEHIYAFAWQT